MNHTIYKWNFGLWGCGIQKTIMLVLPIIQMQTRLEVWMIERVLQVAASILVTILSLG